MPWTTSERVMDVRRRSAPVDVIVETLDGWRRHISGRNASVIAFFGFLSIFPLMLAATTILGFVLQNNKELRDRIIDGAISNIPVLGDTLAKDPTALKGSVIALIIGLGGALWSSTKAFVAIQMALDDVWEVDVDRRAAMPAQRGKALLGIVFIGVAQVGLIVIAALVNAAGLPIGANILLIVGTIGVNILVLAAMYRFLTSAEPNWHDVWPGAIIAGIVYTVLQQFGPLIVNRIAKNASETYGTFAVVLGLVTWLSLLSITALMCAEFNTVLTERRLGSLESINTPD